MPRSSIYLDGYNNDIGTFSFDLEHVNASGGPDFPVMRIFSEITLRNLSEFSNGTNQSHPITLLRASGKLSSPAHRPIATFEQEIAHGTTRSDPTLTQQNLEIPLNLETVTRIEQARAGQNLQAKLVLNFLVAVHRNSNIEFRLGGVRDLAFEIPRSQWVDRILPQLGYRGLEILEVRYSMNATELPKSVQELQSAKQCLLEGQWDAAGLHCRKAVEVILDSRASNMSQTARFKDKVDAFCAANVPDAAQARLVSEQMQYLFSTGSQPAHPAPPLKRLDAEYLVRTTTALIEYMSKLLG